MTPGTRLGELGARDRQDRPNFFEVPKLHLSDQKCEILATASVCNACHQVSGVCVLPQVLDAGLIEDLGDPS
jgi:hypothetical protein